MQVLCETTVFHPNIDMDGHVCLNILREDWKPVLTIQSVIMGLQFLMLEPNADDPLNKEVRLCRAELGRPGATPPSLASSKPASPKSRDSRSSQAAKMMADNRPKFTQIVRDTFKGRSMQVGAKRYDFPRFE